MSSLFRSASIAQIIFAFFLFFFGPHSMILSTKRIYMCMLVQCIIFKRIAVGFLLFMLKCQGWDTFTLFVWLSAYECECVYRLSHWNLIFETLFSDLLTLDTDVDENIWTIMYLLGIFFFFYAHFLWLCACFSIAIIICVYGSVWMDAASFNFILLHLCSIV